MSGNESGYSSAEEDMATAQVPIATPVASQPATKSSGGAPSGAIIGVLAAGAVVVGGVAYKLLSGKGPKASPKKKVVSPSKKTVTRRTTDSSSVASEPAAANAAAAAPSAAAAPAATQQRSAAPTLPARPAAKTAAAPAAAATAAAAVAAEAEAAAQQKAAAEKAAAEKAAAEKAAAEKAAAEKVAAEKAAAEKAAAEKAAAEKAAAEKAAAEKAAAEKAAAVAAAEKAASEKAAAEKAAAEKAAAEKAAAVAAAQAAAQAAAPATAEPAAVEKAAAAEVAEPAAPLAEQPAAAAEDQPAESAEAANGAAEAAAEADVEGGEVQHHVMPTPAEVAALVVAAEPAAPAAPADGDAAPKEEEGEVVRLGDIPVPTLSFECAPAEGDLNELEQKARDMSLHAHKVVKEKNNVVQGAKEQKAALDLLLQPENAGKARPHLVAACAFALGDMLLAQRKVDETKQALAVAYQTAKHIEDKGPMVRALMNYAYITKSERKVAATEATYAEALELARAQHGPRHGMVEKIKYELSAFLGSTGREAAAANLLIESASEMLAEAEKLAGEEASGQEGGEGSSGGDKAAAAPAEPAEPSGFEHAEAEAAAAAATEEEEEEEMTPAQTAQHYAMRNLMNAAGVLDGLQQYQRGEELLAKALDIAVVGWGAGSMQHLNVLYALAQHFRRRAMLQESIDFHEQVLAIMDEKIQVYSPELLQHRIAILRDVAVLMDKVGQGEAAVDYATGALVNAQTLAGIMMGQQRSTTHPILEPFYRLLADLKLKIGDEEGAAEAKRMLNESRLHQRLSQVGGKQQQRGKPSGSKRAAGNGASTARAGGRRV